MDQSIGCSVCGCACTHLDAVDFNKSCIEAEGRRLPRTGVMVDYVRCGQCGFCFAPELCDWDMETFKELIYNQHYIGVDPDYVEVRPRTNASSLISMFGADGNGIQHLDYGGGNGLLSRVLADAGWQTRSFDPFVDPSVRLDQLGKYDLITALEVFEHVPDVQSLMIQLCALRSEHGLILFSTILSDDYIHPGQPLAWWYASPRNGHISLYTKNSLELLASQHGLRFCSQSEGVHVFFQDLPSWAKPLFGMA